MPKNPWSAAWTTTVGTLAAHDLTDLLRPLEALAKAEGWTAPRRRQRTTPQVDGARGTGLFDAVRHRAYESGETNQATLLAYAQEEAARLGSPAKPRMMREVARSIARFMLTRWSGKRKTAPLPLAAVKARQAAAAQATATTRRTGTALRLAEADAALLSRGERATLAALAAEAGVSVSTVQRHRAAPGHTLPPLSASSSDPMPFSLPFEAARGPVAFSATQELSILVPVIAALAPPWLPRRLARLVGHGSSGSSLVRLVGVGGGTAAHFLSRKDKAALSCFDRESWHREEARAGLRSYASALAYRRGRLYAERKAELDRLQADVQKHGDLLQDSDPGACIVTAAAVMELLRLATMAWASRIKAEDRAEARMKAAVDEQDGKPVRHLRTVRDSMDLFLAGLPSTKAA